MNVAQIFEKMVAYSDHNLHDIAHLTKVWAYAKTIGELEGLDKDTQFILEVSAIVHDIACPLCRKKYGNTAGVYQEKEGMPLTEAFLSDTGLSQEQIRRCVYLVGHHHTFHDIEGLDYQILVEADFLVNADESNYDKKRRDSFYHNVFKTKAGKRLFQEIYGSEDE